MLANLISARRNRRRRWLEVEELENRSQPAIIDPVTNSAMLAPTNFAPGVFRDLNVAATVAAAANSAASMNVGGLAANLPAQIPETSVTAGAVFPPLPGSSPLQPLFQPNSPSGAPLSGGLFAAPTMPLSSVPDYLRPVSQAGFLSGVMGNSPNQAYTEAESQRRINESLRILGNDLAPQESTNPDTEENPQRDEMAPTRQPRGE